MRIFFSAPFTDEYDFQVAEYIDRDYERMLKGISDLLRSQQHEVYLAQETELARERVLTTSDAAKKDFYVLSACSDVVLCYPKQSQSIGVRIELGWASALGKPIILLKHKSEEIHYYCMAPL